MTASGAKASAFIFLHGGGQGAWVWSETVAAMHHQSAAPVRALSLDIPGCGTKRGRDTGGLGIPEVIAELAADIDRAGFGDAILVGHSQAGTVLPGLLAARPDLFRRVVYVACCAPAPGQTVKTMMGSGLHGSNPAVVGWPLPVDNIETAPFDQLAPMMFCNDMDPAEAQAFMSKLGLDQWPAACGADYRDWRYDLSGATPATYVLALRDRSLPPAWQRRFAERVGADRIVSIDAGHQVMNTRPQALAEVLLHEAG